MEYTEIYADEAGVTHFRDAEIAFRPASDGSGPAARLVPARSEVHAAEAGFLTVPAGWDSGWHNAPSDGYAVLLRGRVEIETGDGARRVFGVGDVWRSTDTEGPGHVSRVVGPEDAVVVLINFTAVRS